MKRIIALVLVLTFAAAALCACGDKATQTIQLGTSAFFVTINASYQKGTISSDDTSEGQVAYYYSEDSLLDFDIYQWNLASGETLEAAAKNEAKEYGATVDSKTIGKTTVYFYNAKEESEGKKYDTVSYLMENNGTVVEIVFWLDGKNAAKTANAIMDTLTVKEGEAAGKNEIKLGTSSLHVTPAKAYKAGTISAEDTDENQVGYFYSDDTPVDFDVYMWAKASGETLAAAAAEEAASYNAEVKDAEFNGIKVVYYNAVENNEGTDYNTVTYMMEDGDSIVEIVFWLDGETANDEVAQIMGSLAR